MQREAALWEDQFQSQVGYVRSSVTPKKCSAKMTTFRRLMGPGILGILVAQRFSSHGDPIRGGAFPRAVAVEVKEVEVVFPRNRGSEVAIHCEDRPRQVDREVVDRRKEAGQWQRRAKSSRSYRLDAGDDRQNLAGQRFGLTPVDAAAR